MKTTAIGLFLLFCTAAGLGQTCPGSNDPWYSLGCYAQGMMPPAGHPVITISDASGVATQNFISTSHALGALVNMIINVDTSIEPEMLAGTSNPSQSSCNTFNLCIQRVGTGGSGVEAGQFSTTNGVSSLAGPTVAYFRLACTSASSLPLTAATTGRWSREFIVTGANTGAQALTIFSPIASSGTPTCPNNSTHYAVAVSVDPPPPTPPGVWYPGLASGAEIIQAVVAMGTDFKICSTCTQTSLTTSGSSPGQPQSATYNVTGHTGSTQINLSSNLLSSFGQPNAKNIAVYGYDDTIQIGAWLTAVAVSNSGATGYCPPGSYLWNGTNTWAQGNPGGQVYLKMWGAGHAGNFGSQATGQQGTCEFVTIGTSTALSLNSSALNNFGGAEISNVSFREGVPGVLGNTGAPIYGTLSTGMIFQDLSFTNYENTAGIIIDAGSSSNTSQYNDFVRPLCSDTLSCIVFKKSDADNRITGGRFFGSRTGGGAGIDQQANGTGFAGGYTWVYGFNAQYTPVVYKQYGRAGASVHSKAENTYGTGGATLPAAQIGSNGTGTFAVLDGPGSPNPIVCIGNRLDDEQVGYFGLGAYISSNCTNTQLGLFRFRGTTLEYYDNGATSTFLSHTIKVPLQAWSTSTSLTGQTLCLSADCPAGVYRVDLYIEQLSQGSGTPCGGSSTVGTYIVKISYTDDTGALKSLLPIPIGGIVATDGGLNATMANAYGTGSFVLKTNGSANITYGAQAFACSAGTGPSSGNFYLTINRLTAN